MKTLNEIKYGVILSYLLIFINMTYGLLIIPFILNQVGSVDYGVYKSIASLSASLAVLDLGLGSTMTRYMSKYSAEKDSKGANNFAAMVFVQYLIITGVIVIVGLCVFVSIDTIYEKHFSEEALSLAKKLLVILIINMILRLFENLLTGIANGFGRFIVSNGVRLSSIIFKIILIYIFLPRTHNVVMIVIFELGITLCAIIILMVYIIKVIGMRPKLIWWDKEVFKESLGYTSLMFLQTMTIQFNGNIDNVLIGAQLGAVSVTIYSMALQLFGMYQNLSGAIANIMLPTMTKKVVQGQTSEQLQQTVEKCGRMQFLILAAALGGFIVLGKDFFFLWLGKGYEDCYYIVLLLIVPVTFTMVQNVALSILRACNKMVYRTVTLLISCVVNVSITIIGLKYLGYWGAALGTAAATISNLVFMNIYYHVNLGFKIIPFFIHIIKRIFSCALISVGITFVFHFNFNGTWSTFIGNVSVFMLSYVFLLYKWGLKKEEKELLLGRFAPRRTR